jgi:hypothetical protein
VKRRGSPPDVAHHPDLTERRAGTFLIATRSHDLKDDLTPIGRKLHVGDPANAQDELRRENFLLRRSHEGYGKNEGKDRDRAPSDSHRHHRWLLPLDVMQAASACRR